MSENNYELLKAECDVREQLNLKKLCRYIALSYKQHYSLTIFIDVEWDRLVRKGSMQLRRFTIQYQGEQIGTFYLYERSYKDAIKKGIMPKYFNHKDSTLNSQFKRQA